MELAYQVTRGGLLTEKSDIGLELKKVLKLQAQTLLYASEMLPESAADAFLVLAAVSGKLFFSGAGKSGLVARKLAATFSSLSIPSLFIHPYDATHGDLGAISKHDCLVVLSKTASSNEIDLLMRVVKAQGTRTILIACQEGPLNNLADASVILPFDQEACPHNLAPTNSSTLMMAFGDALALTLSTSRGLQPADFARVHPSGSLGKRLTLRVDDIMHTGLQMPVVGPAASLSEAIMEMTRGKLGHVFLVDEANHLHGVISDGDLRRALFGLADVSKVRALEISTRNPKIIASGELAQTAINMMEHYGITALAVLKEGSVIGVIHIHDLVKAGLVAL